MKVVKKRNKRRIIENKLDKAISRLCRQQGFCTLCNRKDLRLNAHHFKSRKYKGTRWYLPNLVALCIHHHVWNFHFSAHKTPEKFKKRMIELRGQKWVDDIEKRAMEHTKWLYQDLEELLDELVQGFENDIIS